jgi:hypothetical protein
MLEQRRERFLAFSSHSHPTLLEESLLSLLRVVHELAHRLCAFDLYLDMAKRHSPNADTRLYRGCSDRGGYLSKRLVEGIDNQKITALVVIAAEQLS